MKFNPKITCSAFLSVLALSAFVKPAQSQTMIDATNPNAILNIAKGFGSANLTKDNVGDPSISGMIEGVRYSVFFYGCSSGRSCKEIQLRSSWDSTDVSMQTMTRWNQKNRVGRAYLYENGHPAIDMIVNLNYGVSSRNLEDTFDTWRIILNKFKKDYIEKN